MSKDFFPEKPDVNPSIYAYELKGVDSHKGLLKVGYTTRSVEERIKEQLGTAQIKYRIVLNEDAIRNDGTTFTDHEVHRYLKRKKIRNMDGEWFECSVKQVRSAIQNIRLRKFSVETRELNFKMRPEQEEAVKRTAEYFRNYKKEDPSKVPHFLWNAKMRFGKTFTAYQLAKEMKWTKVLVMTFKPAVESAWDEDLREHIDFEGWQFVSASEGALQYENIDKEKPFVCFGSFQDYLGRNKYTGGIKTKNKWVHETEWDCVILDEYHYGAWRESAKDLFEAEGGKEKEFAEGEGLSIFDERILPIRTQAYLYLSGTPFRAIASGEFIEEQIYNWTYSDEQKAKKLWSGDKDVNPYASLPRMVLMTYQLPDSIIDIAEQGEFSEFDLNEFFYAEGRGGRAKFRYEDEVQKWLDLIRGAFLETAVDNLKMGSKKPPLPFSHVPLLNVLNHTLWFLPSVASCFAMANLLKKRQNVFYHNYKIVVVAGNEAGIGIKALPPVLDVMEDPLRSKTITLTCGKLLTGVTVRPWTGIFMLRNISTPETYFQAAFRVQSPWIVKNPNDRSPNKEEIVKKECYIFDFAPNRALSQIADYSCRLNVDESNPEVKVDEFINFLPILAYDGSAMRQIDAKGVLDMAMSGTTATLLARRWESALLVNVDNNTLKRLMNDKKALDALMSIEGFRKLNQEIEIIINKSEAVERIKREANDKELTRKEKKELSKEEKEYRSLRKQIQEKLIKFATRIPVFMYLTDYRERALKDVIIGLEPNLFKRVTGLTKKDFEVLVSLGVFNGSLMNDAVYKFKRYEDASLRYAGINKHKDEEVGLYDTTISKEEYEEREDRFFVNKP